MADGSVVIETKLDNSGVEKGVSGLKGNLGKLGSVAQSALKGVAVATGVVTTAFAGLVTASVNARGEIEQQLGGVETLFKNNADKVIKNAENAYKTAGMSASDYMQTVTSFSASLLQSVGKDTAKAADVADMALIDMADNANKFGTSMEAIQNAYQGFAKQNYTMLDNLKLGYGGTKTEMERLLKDAQKITGIKYDINNLSDVYNAIHVIQKDLEITGTTATEASTTLQGSLASMKASWTNLLSGSGNMGNVIDSVTDVISNVVRIVSDAVPDIMENITEWLPELIQLGITLLSQIGQGIMSYLPTLMSMAVDVIQQLLNTFIENLPMILQMGITILIELVKGIAQSLPTLIPTIVDAVLLMVETLIDNIDLIIDAGIQLIIGLAEGLIEAIPRLIDKIPIIIEKLLNAIVNNLPKLIEMGIQLIVQLAIGLVKAIPQLVAKIPEIISAIVKAIIGLLGKLNEVGRNLVEGLWNGIKNSFTWIKNKISGWIGDVMTFIKNLFGIHSPSTLFRDEIGQYLGLGMGEGFTESLDDVYKDMRKAVDQQNAKLTSNLTTSNQIKFMNNDNRQATLESIDNNREISVTSVVELDSKVAAEAVNKVNAKQKLQYGLA